MKERPILFSAPMVRAILGGTKTQTRRIIKPQPEARWNHVGGSAFCTGGHDRGDDCDGDVVLSCPYGQLGDRLWVRETWAKQPNGQAIYCADLNSDGVSRWAATWKPSIHMPRWASRILLEIVSVRVERLQDISEDDAQAEGIAYSERFCGYCIGEAEHFNSHDPRQSYFSLWEAINGAGSVIANPWVWVVEFRRVETTEGRP